MTRSAGSEENCLIIEASDTIALGIYACVTAEYLTMVSRNRRTVPSATLTLLLFHASLLQRFFSVSPYLSSPSLFHSLFHSLILSPSLSLALSISSLFLSRILTFYFSNCYEHVPDLRNMDRNKSGKKLEPRRNGFKVVNRRNIYSVIIVLLTILEFGSVPQHRIGFYCNDPKISFKFMGDTISITLLIGGCLLLPILVMWLSEFACYSADSYNRELGCAGSRAKQIWLWYGHYSIGLIALTFMCNVMKTLVGEPRPHFLDTCKPKEAINCTDGYVGTYTCTNTNDSEWFISDSSKSFPSGHSALSMFTTIFIVWYLQCRLPNRTFFLKPWLQCMICLWVVICSLTRIGDNRHHWWDVLAGNILGLAFSVLTVIMSCRKFHLNQNVSQIYNESIENEQINYNNKRKQSVKKLLHETPVDVSESRELKNVKSSTWKE